MDQENTPDTPETTVEDRARELGWRPKEDFAGNDEDFIDAKEFVRRQPLFDKIADTSKELKSVRKALDSFKDHYSRVEETALNKAIAKLRAERREAFADGDGERFEAVEKELQDTQEALGKLKEPDTSQDTPVEFAQFQKKNSWYNTDSELTTFANRLGQGLAATGMLPGEVLSEIEKQVRNRFPTKFKNSAKDEAPDVEAGRRPGGKKGDDTAGLSPDELKIMNTLVRQGAITKEKYLADLKKIKGQ